MDNSIYTLLAGEVGIFNNLNVVSKNVASANLVGYKKDQMLFKEYLTKDIKDANSMPNDISTLADLTQGNIRLTNRSFDLAINGNGFFMVQTPLGIRYTRNGHFTKDANNLMVTTQGYPVLSIDGNQIIFEDNDEEPEITSDGNLYIRGEQRGQIGVVNFENPKLLRKVGENLFISDLPAELSDSYSVKQGALEESNVSPITEITRLIELQRLLETSSSLIDGIYTMHKSAYKAMSKT